MHYNNRLLNSCLFLLTHESLTCCLLDVKHMSVIIHEKFSLYNVKKYDKNYIYNKISDFIDRNGIEKELKLHFIVDEPVNSTTIFNDELYSFVKTFSLKKGMTLEVDSVADMLAYRKWNQIGFSHSSKRARDDWGVNSRIALIYNTLNSTSISMINNGQVIKGLSLEPFKNDIQSVLIKNIKTSNNPFMQPSSLDYDSNSLKQWEDSVPNVVYRIFDILHPYYIYLYNNPYVKSFFSIHNKIINFNIINNEKESLLDNIVEAVIMKDAYFDGEHYYMKKARGDYQDISIQVEDNQGNIQTLPVFQH